MKRKTTKIKARVMWGYQSQLKIGQAHIANSRIFPEMNTPLFVLPATAEAYDRMQVQIAKAMSAYSWPSGNAYWMNDAEKALAAIGITRPTQ